MVEKGGVKMPKISKIRIVNAKYRNTYILDNIYDCCDKTTKTPDNTLINLENAGGKTILTQLIMQVPAPRVKIQTRKIEGFFKEAKNHSFILLEWTKDNSSEKLVTGIAISATTSTNENIDDDNFARRIKYYTFLLNYSDYNTPYDIINMELSSKNESGVFVPAEYDFVKKLAKKNNRIRIYSS